MRSCSVLPSVHQATISHARKDSELHYQAAGATPLMPSGVLQVNVKVPPGLPAGTVPILIRVGTAASQSGVTASVR